jgi:L-lactate dehydrogenase complex protein LldG
MLNELFHKIRSAITDGPIRKMPIANPEPITARLISESMTPAECIELMISRDAMSGAVIHRPKNAEQLFDAIRKIVPAGSTILIDQENEKNFSSAIGHEFKCVPLEQADDENLFSAAAAITGVDFAVAETASIVLADRRPKSRLATNTVEIHIALIHSNQIVPDLLDMSKKISEISSEKIPGGITLISGPSKTSDIEMNLVVGVHGPGQLHYIILPD